MNYYKSLETLLKPIPEEELIPFAEATQVATLLIYQHNDKELQEKAIRFIKKRHIEDLITIQMVAPMVFEGLKKLKKTLTDDNLTIIRMIVTELGKFPGGYMKHHESEESKALVFKIAESSYAEEIYIYQTEQDALLLDTDAGLTLLAMMAYLQNDNDTYKIIYKKRENLAQFRNQIQQIINDMEDN